MNIRNKRKKDFELYTIKEIKETQKKIKRKNEIENSKSSFHQEKPSKCPSTKITDTFVNYDADILNFSCRSPLI